MTWALARRSILLATSLALLGCDPADPSGEDEAGETGETDESDDEPAAGISPASLTWLLDWEPLDGATIINDLGYEIRVDAGWIGTWGMTLVACASADASAATREPDAQLGVASPWLIGEGHSSGEDDPSAWVFAGVESLVDPQVVAADALALTGTRYCQAHHLFAPISEASEGFAAAEAALAERDPNATLAGASVVVIGSWTAPGGGEPAPFVLRSEQAYGKILALELAEAPADAAVEVALTRGRAGMFDNIDLATALPEDAAWILLGNLAKQTRAVVRAGE